MTEYDIVQGNTIGSFPVNNSPSHVQATLIPACMDAIRAIVREEFYAHIVEEQEQKLNEIFESANKRDWEDSDQLQSAISKGHIKLDEQSSVWIDHDSNEVHLYNQGELSSLSPKQALSLLAYLLQQRQHLEEMEAADKPSFSVGMRIHQEDIAGTIPETHDWIHLHLPIVPKGID